MVVEKISLNTIVVNNIKKTGPIYANSSKLIICEFGRCPTRSDNAYFANNGQASLVFTAAFCFAYAAHNLIKLT